MHIFYTQGVLDDDSYNINNLYHNASLLKFLNNHEIQTYS